MERPSLLLHLTADEMDALQSLAQQLGCTPEEAAARAMEDTLKARYRLAQQRGKVCPIRPETGPASWERII